MTRWSDSDLARLRCLSQTHTMAEAAKELGRCYDSVAARVKSERIPWRHKRQHIRWERKIARRTIVGAHGVPYEALSAKERAILMLVAHGLSNAQIAAKLGLPVHSVRSVHMPAMQTKLHAVNRVSLVVLALKLGLVRLDDIELEQVMAATYERQEERA